MLPSVRRADLAQLPLALAVVLLTACPGAGPHEATIRGEKLMLQKQIDGLHTLTGALQRGTLTRPDQLLVGADEATVESLIAATLPQEHLVGNRFRIRLERAQVRFRGNQGMVTLSGRATDEAAPGTFVDVFLKGALDDMTVRHDSGDLTGRVAIYTLEVQRAAAIGAENRAVRELAQALGEARMESLAGIGPPVVIPLHLHEDIAFHELDAGPVTALPGALHVQLKVAKVLAVSGRLWVMLDVVAGPWLSDEKAAH